VELSWKVLEWTDGASEPVITLIAATVLFLAAFYGLAPRLFVARMEASGSSPEAAQATSVLLSRVSRGLLMGVGCLLTNAALGSSPRDIGVAPVSPLETAVLAIVGFVVLQAMYPEIRARVQPPKLVRQSIIAWAVYLWGYELLFRGFLLFELVAHWGVWPGLTITTVLYVMAHLDKLADETAGSLFAGFIFGAMALLTGGIWAPWLLHTLIATSTEALAVRANPEIRFGMDA
jgi:membrane protease YdiL (CAAX protease family)